MSKETGLAAFARKGREIDSLLQQPITMPIETQLKRLTNTRQRGKGEIVALTIRLPRAEWIRVHQLAIAEGISIQALAVEGLSRIFIDKGLPSLNE